MAKISKKGKVCDRLKNLSAAVDKQLQEFVSDGTGEGLAPENYIQNRVKRKKRKNAVMGASAALGGAGGMAVVSRLKPVRAKVASVGEKVGEKVAGGRKKVRTWATGKMKSTQKAGMNAHIKGVQTGSNKLLRKGRRLRKVSRGLQRVAKTFDAKEVKAMAGRIVQLESRLAAMEG